MTGSAEPSDHPVGVSPPAVSRREVVRKSLIAAGVAAWTGPTVVSWAISPAHAVSPVPTDLPPGATRPAELARTGTSLLPIAAGGAAAVGAGAVALRVARQHASPEVDHHQRSPRADHNEPADQR